MAIFETVQSEGRIDEMIESVFSMKLSVGGDWGYEQSSATIIYASELPLPQLEHTLASMRAHLEMSLMPGKEERYGSINLNESGREAYREKGKLFHRVRYDLTAMKETLYNHFVNEYKEGYGKDDFDMAEHFRRRKEATLERSVEQWFEIRDEGLSR